METKQSVRTLDSYFYLPGGWRARGLLMLCAEGKLAHAGEMVTTQ